MSVFNSLARWPVVPSMGSAVSSMWIVGQRQLSTSLSLLREKYWKVTKYAKPIDETVYQAGDSAEGLKIPLKKKLVPDYKYEAMFFKYQNRGLYGGLERKLSKTCSESGNKNLRAHKPNIVRASLWSETLGRLIKTKVSTKVLKTIDREGGLDNYLTKDKPARVKTMGLKGWKLKYEIMKQQELNELPKVEKNGELKQVYHIHPDGKQVLVGRTRLLRELYSFAKRDTYTPLVWDKFLREHTVLSMEELVNKLEHYKYDFTPITA